MTMRMMVGCLCLVGMFAIPFAVMVKNYGGKKALKIWGTAIVLCLILIIGVSLFICGICLIFNKSG